MRGFATYHPVSLLVYFVLILIVTMFLNIPVILILSLFGAWSYNLVQDKATLLHGLFYDSIFFIIIAISNPIFIHRGRTILFFLNGKAITLEAATYGAFMAVMMLAVFHWCRVFAKIMTSDKLLYLCGKLTPNLSIVMSMALRYIPLFRIRSVKVNDSQTAMGLYTGEGYIEKTKGSLRIFSIVLTWSLENAINTANSMRARGYGIGKRSQFSIYRFKPADLLLVITCIILTGITLYSCSTGRVEFKYYPRLGGNVLSMDTIAIYIACGLLTLLPVFIELKEKLKWKYYKSRI